VEVRDAHNRGSSHCGIALIFERKHMAAAGKVTAAFHVPEAVTMDSQVVRANLTTARTLIQAENYAEALRYLRRAVDAAGRANNDARTLMLARAAADLANQINGDSVPPRAVSSNPEPLTFTAVSTIRPIPNKRASLPPPPFPQIAKPSVRGALSSSPLPSFAGRPHLPPVTKQFPTLPPPPKPVNLATRPAGHSAVMEQLIEQGKAIRVYVRRSTHDSELFIMRSVSSGHARRGMHEAILVLSETSTGRS
jgi:hypothetical protein